MTKNILAIAIAAAVAAPVAFADATVYGNAHMSGNSFSSIAGNGSSTGLNAISSNSSYVGIKGAEDLSGGVKAVYQMEFGVDMDGNNAAGANAANGINSTRNTFVGLGGGFGTVLAGRHDSFIKASGRKYDLFGDQVGNNRNILGGANPTASFVVDGRHNNVFAYVAPSFGGVTIAAAYVGGDAVKQTEAFDNASATSDNVKRSALTAMVDYTAGNFSTTLGYINIANPLTTGDIVAYRLGAGYTFGAAKVVALYQNANTLQRAGAVTGSQDTYGIGGSYKVGAAGTIKAQYYMANDVSGAKIDGTLTTVGYDHALSKNTTAYAVYAAAHNGTNGTYTTDMTNSGSGSNVAAVMGKDNSALSVGIIHKF
jgi:predicted porin